MGLVVYYYHHGNHISVSPTEDLLKLPGLFEPQVPLLSLLIAHSCQQHLSDPLVSLEPALVGSHQGIGHYDQGIICNIRLFF